MIGRSLAHFTVTGLLGKGGMGEVYLAHDTKLDRDVALKVLPADMAADPTRLSRFVREAKMAAGLNHPNIVTLHSVDEADGVHFLTMELVAGQPLGALMPPEGFPLERLVELACPIADALASAHAKGIIHRDLKPGNVMVTEDGSRIKVLDFGLAKLYAPPGKDGSQDLDTLTATGAGVLLGTPRYMSPEQARGEEVDHRSDIFSFGVILYEMATGKQPFNGGSTVELLSSVLRDEPSPVSKHRPELPAALEYIISRCLAKAPEDRYASARDLHNDLIALKTESAVTLGPGQTLDRTGPFSSIQNAPQSGGGSQPASTSGPSLRIIGAGLLVAALAVMFWVWRSGHESGAPDPTVDGRIVAVLPFENLGNTEDEYFAAGITDEITSRLASIEGLSVISRTSARVYAGTQKSIPKIGEELGSEFILEGTIRWDQTGGHGRVRISPRLIRVANDTQVWADSYDREVNEIFALQAEIASRIAQALDITLLAEDRQALEIRPTENIEAYHAYLQGLKQLQAPGFGRESFELGVQMFERAIELDPRFALAFAGLSSMNARLYHYGFDRAPERLKRAKLAADRALALQPDLAEAHLAMGHYFYWGTRDYPRALAAFEEAHELNPSMSEVLLSSAYVKRRQGEFDSALALMEKYRILSPMDPNAFVALGETYGALRRYPEAEEAFKRAVALKPDDPYPYTELGLLYLRWRGDVAKAREILARAPFAENGEACRVGYLVEMIGKDYAAALARIDGCSRTVLEAGAFYTPLDLIRGTLLHLAGRDEDAQLAFENALSHLQGRINDIPDDHRLQGALGLAYAGLGKAKEAVLHGERAVALYPLEKDALEAPVQIINLALIHTMLGQGTAAIQQLEQVLSVPSIMSVALLRSDPQWDSLRELPEFEAMLERFQKALSD